MTEHTPVPVQIMWEPVTEGIALGMDSHDFVLNLQDVVELWKDMEEARMLARGYEKVEETVIVPEEGWIVKVMGNDFRIANTFVESRGGGYEGVWVVLQDDEGREIAWPSEDLVTAYRPIE